MSIKANKQHAAFLRQRADAQDREAAALRREADRLDPPPAVPTPAAAIAALRGTAAKAAAFIDANPGALGKDIAAGIRVSHDHFRSKIWPQLRGFGYRNLCGGLGYWAHGKFPKTMWRHIERHISATHKGLS